MVLKVDFAFMSQITEIETINNTSVWKLAMKWKPCVQLVLRLVAFVNDRKRDGSHAFPSEFKISLAMCFSFQSPLGSTKSYFV